MTRLPRGALKVCTTDIQVTGHRLVGSRVSWVEGKLGGAARYSSRTRSLRRVGGQGGRLGTGLQRASRHWQSSTRLQSSRKALERGTPPGASRDMGGTAYGSAEPGRSRGPQLTAGNSVGATLDGWSVAISDQARIPSSSQQAFNLLGAVQTGIIAGLHGAEDRLMRRWDTGAPSSLSPPRPGESKAF